MKARWQVVGEVERTQHAYLRQGDACYFFGEYTPHRYTNGQMNSFSTTNQLIGNLKKSMDKANTPAWKYKLGAINSAAVRLQAAMAWDSHIVQQATYVPMPPHKAKTDILYDDRIFQILQKLSNNAPVRIDVRDMLFSNGQLRASHENNGRATPADIERSLAIDATLAQQLPRPQAFFLFDDVLTTGAHFVGASELLKRAFPGVPVVGLFLARTVRPEVAGDEFLDLL